MNKYLIVIEKLKNEKVQWWGYEIVADGIEEVMGKMEDEPKIWADCDAWDIISIHKQWKTGGQMVMEVHSGRLL